jgi:hypothetical protein
MLIGVLGSLLLAAPAQVTSGGMMVFNGPGETEPRFRVVLNGDRLSPVKVSPQHKWEFEWLAAGYGTQAIAVETPPELRFRVFNQQRKEGNDPAPFVARMALRMWDWNVRRLKLDHALVYNRGVIDFYLCFGGQAGGEQMFDEEIENGFARKVNTIYIYRIDSFTDPVEMAREIAHEYGHATLPPMGGFESPEEWGNGYLGERLYLRWMRDELASKRLGPEDAMEASAPQLDAWVKKNVDPLWRTVAGNGPDLAQLAGKGQKAMDAYLGLTLWAETILPRAAFARSIKLTGSVKATDYLDGIELAIKDGPKCTLNIPATYKGKPVWVPLPTGSKLSGAAVKAKRGNWAKVVPAGTSVAIINPTSGQ